MTHGTYFIVCESTEDRLDEAYSLDEAVRIARGWVKEAQAGNPVLIEHDGRVIHQFVLTADGVVEEAAIR